MKVWIISIHNLTVEVNVKYIKGMINNLDIQPNASINWRISTILLFNFKLQHIPGFKHAGLDGLSHCQHSPEDDEPDDMLQEIDDWLDDIVSCGIWIMDTVQQERHYLVLKVVKGREEVIDDNKVLEISTKQETLDNFTWIQQICDFLQTLQPPKDLSCSKLTGFLHQASEYFISGEKLCWKQGSGRHQLVMDIKDRFKILHKAHNDLGHKGIYSMQRLILDQFWWPSVEEDVNWFIKTCHQCQIHSIKKVVIPPIISIPVPLFWKAHIDTMYMPLVQGYHYIIQACCLLIDWLEWWKLKKENGRTIGMFIFEEILCWWGGCEKVVTNYALAMVAALDWLSKMYHINHIQISAYNSRANSIVKCSIGPCAIP